MIGGLQGENRDLYKKHMNKKSNRVVRKYMGLHRWISQVEFCDFATCEIVFQLGAVVFQWS